VQYQFAVKRTTSAPSCFPMIVVRCAATDPAAISPASRVVSRRAAATSPVHVHSSTGSAAASASSPSAGENSPSRYPARLVSNAATGVPNFICSNSMWGESRRDTTVLAGEIGAGSVAAQRTTIIGKHAGADVVRFTANWYCTTDVDPAWDLRPTGWRVRVLGDAPFDVDLPFPIPVDDLASFTPAYTANRPVNAIPYVCAASPGILSTADLPPITPAGPR